MELTGQTSVLYLSILFFTPPMLQISVFEDSTENCILEPRKPRSED